MKIRTQKSSAALAKMTMRQGVPTSALMMAQALAEISQWVSDVGPLAGKGPMDVALRAREVLTRCGLTIEDLT